MEARQGNPSRSRLPTLADLWKQFKLIGTALPARVSTRGKTKSGSSESTGAAGEAVGQEELS
jgi:hypothetical protein